MPIKFKNTAVSEPFAFDSIGNHWAQEPVLRPRGLPCYLYLQTESGCGRIEIQGEKYLLSEGQGVLIAPFIPYFYSRESARWMTCFATFSGTLAASIPRMLGNKPVIFTDSTQCEQISALIDRSMLRYDSLPVDERALSVDCYSVLMCFLERISTDNLSQEPLYQRYIVPVIKEIETHFDTPLTVQTLSHLVYVTPQYLTRLFERFLGCSVHEYLTGYRINAAKELLILNPRMPVQEVALRSGFDAASHFIATFKKRTGLTPGDFRKMH